jgi:hypothetical protein
MGRDFDILRKCNWGICRFEPNIMELCKIVVGVITLSFPDSI